LLLQAPLASQVPAQLSGSSAPFTATQVPELEQVEHVPLQSAGEQQLASGMHARAPQGFDPTAQSYLQVLVAVSHFPALPA